MADVVIYPYQGSVAVVYPTATSSIQFVIDNVVPDGSPYAVIDSAEVPSQQNGYRAAWAYDFEAPSSTLTVDLATSKTIFQEQKDIAADGETQPLTQEYVIAVAGGQPTGTIEAAVNAIQVARTNTDYLAATDINDLTSYWPAELGKNPFVPQTSGVIFTGRGAGLGPEDLNVSYFVEWISTVVESDTELYVPGTATTIAYGSGGSGRFDSFGNCFNPGDYLIQIRQASTSFVLAEFEVPLNPAGENVTF